ncbi:hypothetical protein [Nonomuraea jabiensis]|uniref:Uncharacterized protein n=1 Tax=Nonomuraea jabiensis TaxID=882448 RepID=A0A7W9GDZ7_9ACTN|nr:hypothetical protein [Nonomuraea jabiensis]MBB5782064.1 hypothetical protein [Nonomuraea jabiensis]
MSLVAAIAASPFLLLYAAAMAHPLPPGTTFDGSEPQGPVIGDSGDCWAGFAFSLRTERPPEEIKRYYEAAPFMRTDADFSELSVSVSQESADHVSVAVGTISSGIGDLRCW